MFAAALSSSHYPGDTAIQIDSYPAGGLFLALTQASPVGEPTNMVDFIFLLKTSHLKEHHKIGFTIFGSQEPEKESLTGGPRKSRDPTCQ